MIKAIKSKERRIQIMGTLTNLVDKHYQEKMWIKIDSDKASI